MERHGEGDRALSLARWWTRMIIDGRGGAECGAGSLMKIVVRESMCQGVKIRESARI
jgi:hypothetical protein